MQSINKYSIGGRKKGIRHKGNEKKKMLQNIGMNLSNNSFQVNKQCGPGSV